MSIRIMVVCAILLITASRVFAQDYEIRLTRDAEAGEKYELTVSGSISKQMTMSSQGQVLQKNASSFTANLEGTVTVLEIDEMKREKKLSLLVSRCLVSSNGSTKEREALPKDTQVVAQIRDGQKEFLIDGNVVSRDIAEMLGILISLPISQATDDDIFGTKEHRKVGDSWPVNGVKGAADLSSKGIKVDAKDIRGNTKVEKLIVAGGTNCLQISSKMEMINITPPLPRGLAVTKSNASAAFSGEFPLDVSIRPLSEAMTVSMVFVAKGKPAPDTPEVTLTMNMEESKHAKQKAVKSN
ncbi:MAG: hypothetical protein ABSA06_09275 [Geobacteraceae bacterium]